jgi:lipoate-protein ligase A
MVPSRAADEVPCSSSAPPVVDTGPVDWIVEHRRGTPQELHDADVDLGARRVVVHRVDSPAVVLGSTQDVRMVDRGATRAAGIDVARRRSGGGAVLLVPDAQVWVDVVVPAGDPLWDDDVCRASWWLGQAWAGALGGGEVHRAGVSDREAGRVACFASVGPGEVVRHGAKALGISQRRTRSGARFQCVAYRSAVAADLVGLLDATVVGPAVWHTVRTALAERTAAPVPAGWDAVGDLLPHLP